ncbi:SMP-30/Gluconolaconase/LRE-like region [Seiridium cupressi]
MQSVLSSLPALPVGNVGGIGTQSFTAAIAQPCQLHYGNQFPSILCIPRHGSVLPEGFERPVSSTPGHADTYGSTVVPDDESFQFVEQASFLIWDLEQAVGILGPNPSVENIFEVPNIPHEAPVYEPDLNIILFCPLRLPPTLNIIDLNENPPTLTSRTSDPPLFGPGAVYHEGLLYYCGSSTHSGNYVAGLYAFNVTSGKAWPVANNYFGYNFGTCDDLAVAPNGDIWFTDNWYTYTRPEMHENNTIQLEAAVYRFVPSTGLVQLVTDELDQPNGIAFSPDGKTVYLTDSGADTLTDDDRRLRYVSHRRRTVYAADVLPSGTGIVNRRAIFLSQDRVPDGVKVAHNGYVVVATGSGVDVLDPWGVHVLRVQTSFTVLNLVWAGKENTDLWVVGYERVARVQWALEGNHLAK